MEHMPELFFHPGFSQKRKGFRHFLEFGLIHQFMKNLLLLSLALVAVTVMLYAGLNGLMKHHSYGSFFTFIGGLTTVGLGMDVVNHLKVRTRKANVRRLGRFW